MKHLLLCAVPKVTEWKECSEQVWRNAWNEVTGGTGTLFDIFNDVGKGKCNDEMSGSTLAQGDLAKCRSYSCVGYRKLLNAGSEKRMTRMKGLESIRPTSKAIQTCPYGENFDGKDLIIQHDLLIHELLTIKYMSHTLANI